MTIITILLLTNLWAGDPNMADPAMRDAPVQGGVPCLDGCGRPTPSRKLTDFTRELDKASDQDTDEGGL